MEQTHRNLSVTLCISTFSSVCFALRDAAMKSGMKGVFFYVISNFHTRKDVNLTMKKHKQDEETQVRLNVLFLFVLFSATDLKKKNRKKKKEGQDISIFLATLMPNHVRNSGSEEER